MLVFLLALPSLAGGASYTLDDSASPFSVQFDSAGARLTVTMKSDGFVWKNPESGGGSNVVVGNVSQADARNLSANATVNGQAITLTFELLPGTEELKVSLGGAAASVGGGVVYPFPFFPADGSGQAVVPVDSGYVVPTTLTAFSPPQGQRGMEWFGGTDSANLRGWVGIVDTPDDYELKVRTGTIAGGTRLGSAPSWRGSNGNPSRNPALLSYERSLRYQFSDRGGYVSLAKRFREDAIARGWVKTLAEKKAEPGAPDLDKLIGAPVCYLWGDGRSTALLDEMKGAGIARALIQVSVNHSDHQKNFPATGLAEQAWFDAIRQRGYLGGFYDIYAAVRTAGQGGSPYDGFFYLWPASAASEWVIVNSNGSLDSRGTISAAKSASFAAATRMPDHIARFSPDAYFFDVVCAVDLSEDFDTANGHFATRSMDRGNRKALLEAAFLNPVKRQITGTEQGRSWAVPALDWAEGKYWLGATGTSLSDGSFNDNSYPEIMVDVQDPSASGQLGNLLSEGYQVPLWDLVFHDCIVTTVHWHRAHNKYLDAWDHADRMAMIRGQAPLLNITRQGSQGIASRQPNTRTDSGGRAWSTRWSVMGARFAQTFANVCGWHRKVGYLEMSGHEWLNADRSVQASDFSADGGLSGQGIVVHLGTWDGSHGITGSPWVGNRKGTILNVSPGQWATYTWDARARDLRIQRAADGVVVLDFSGLPGFTYRVQRSTDLEDWEEAGVAENFHFSEVPASVAGGGFYRVVVETE